MTTTSPRNPLATAYGLGRRRERTHTFTLITWIAIGVLVLMIVGVVVGPAVDPGYDPTGQDLSSANLGFFASSATGAFHPLGTDQLGTDTLSQLIAGGRVSILIAFAATAIAAVIGPLAGVSAGYFGGPVDRVVSALVEVLLAVPRILVIITVVAVFGSSIPLLIVLLGTTGWAGYARIVRAQALSLKEREFVDAAVSMGANKVRILIRHILPQTFNSIVVLASLDLGGVVVTESALSYLGLGVRPPATSWGLLIQTAQASMQTEPRLLFLPSIALILFVLSCNFVARIFTSESGDSRRRLRPKRATSKNPPANVLPTESEI